MYGFFFHIFEGWEGVQDALENFWSMGNGTVYVQLGLSNYQTYGSKGQFFSFYCDEVTTLLTKGKFQSIVTWLKIGRGCPYFWIYKLSLKEVSLTTSLSCWWILSTFFWDYLMGIGIQVGLFWYGWCDFILEFEDRGDSVAHDKTSLVCHWHPLHGT